MIVLVHLCRCAIAYRRSVVVTTAKDVAMELARELGTELGDRDLMTSSTGQNTVQ